MYVSFHPQKLLSTNFNYFKPVLTILLFAAFYLLLATNLHAASFIRFDRMKTSTATTGMICATPVTNDIENSVQVTFPAGYTVSTTLSNWSTDTNNIPSSASAWPGIGNATSVSGQTVTLPSGNLNVGTDYCFNWTNSAAVTTSSVSTNQTGIIRTRNAVLTTIDSTTFGIMLIANDGVSVSGTVPADATDAQVVLTSNAASTKLNEGNEVTFTVTYNSTLDTNAHFVLESSWSQGTIQGTGNTLDVFNYVVGSAQTTDDGTVPVIDTTNRTITWDITSLTPEIDHIVTFKLKIISTLPTTNAIDAEISARGRLINAYTQSSELDFIIQKIIESTGRPGPSATPAASLPARNASPSDAGGPPTTSFFFTHIGVSEISNTYAILTFSTSQLATFTLLYGTSPRSLTKKITGLTLEKIRDVELSELDSDTSYYFKINAANASGKSNTSDIYTFRTAKEKTEFLITKETVTITSGDITLSNPVYNDIVIPVTIPVALKAYITNAENLSDIKIKFRNNKVLGISTPDSPVSVGEVPLIELSPGIFSAQLAAPKVAGVYDLILELKDVYGGKQIRRIPYTMHVSKPLRMFEEHTNKPIENVRLTIERFEESLKRYSSFENRFTVPYKTNENGESFLVLPPGKYKLQSSVYGFKNKEVLFDLGLTNYEYPTLHLIPFFSIAETINYYREAAVDTLHYCADALNNLFVSQRAKQVLLMFIAGLLLLCTALFLSLQSHTGILGLPLFALEKIKDYFSSSKDQVTLVVREQHGKHVPISGTKILVVNNKGQILFSGRTNLLGELCMLKSKILHLKSEIKIHMYRKGYYSFPTEFKPKDFAGEIDLYMFKEQRLYNSFGNLLHWLHEFSVSLLIDVLVILTVISVGIISYQSGIVSSIGFIIPTILIVSIWLLYIKKTIYFYGTQRS